MWKRRVRFPHDRGPLEVEPPVAPPKTWLWISGFQGHAPASEPPETPGVSTTLVIALAGAAQPRPEAAEKGAARRHEAVREAAMNERATGGLGVCGLWVLCLALAPGVARADGGGGDAAPPGFEAEGNAPGAAAADAVASPGYHLEHGLAWAIDVGMGKLSWRQYEAIGGTMRLYLGVGFNMPEDREAPVARASLGYQALGFGDASAALHRHQLATTLHWQRVNVGVGSGASVMNTFGTRGFDSQTVLGGSFTVWIAAQLEPSSGFHAIAPLTVDVLRVGGERVVFLELGVQIGFQRF